jgi:hypothetical protein
MGTVYEFRLQRGSSSRWAEINPILGEGEPGVELDTGKFKIGDGHTDWLNLEYYLTEPYVSGIVEQIVAEYAIPFYVPFGRNGDLTTFTGPRLYFPNDVRLESAVFSVTTAPTGASAIFEILRNGSPSYSVDPTIVPSEFLASEGTLDGAITFVGQTDYLQVQCTQIGSTIPGSNLSVILKMVPA